MESDETRLSRLRVYLCAQLNDSQGLESLAERTLERLRDDAGPALMRGDF